MGSQETVSVDEKNVERAQKGWDAFGVATKWTIIAIALVLALLAALTL